jgi:hypothetical protein
VANLIDQLDAPQARKWEYEEGDVLIGTVLQLGTYSGDYGTCRTVVVEPEEGTTEEGNGDAANEPLLFYASAKTAADELDNSDVAVGDRIGIQYHGMREAKGSGNKYHLFRIGVEKADKLADAIS